MPDRFGSCHTATVASYTLEGHVPVEEVKRLLDAGAVGQVTQRQGILHAGRELVVRCARQLVTLDVGRNTRRIIEGLPVVDFADLDAAEAVRIGWRSLDADPPAAVLAWNALAEHNAALPRLAEFILPAGTRSAAIAHVCRTVARRAERTVITLVGSEPINAPPRQYLNRLSDLMFVLARVLNRFRPDGTVAWGRAMQGDVYSESYDIVADAAGNSYTVGQLKTQGWYGTDTLPGHGATDAFIVKFDSLGNYVWGKTFGGTLDDYLDLIHHQDLQRLGQHPLRY